MYICSCDINKLFYYHIAFYDKSMRWKQEFIIHNNKRFICKRLHVWYQNSIHLFQLQMSVKFNQQLQTSAKFNHLTSVRKLKFSISFVCCSIIYIPVPKWKCPIKIDLTCNVNVQNKIYLTSYVLKLNIFEPDTNFFIQVTT